MKCPDLHKMSTCKLPFHGVGWIVWGQVPIFAENCIKNPDQHKKFMFIFGTLPPTFTPQGIFLCRPGYF